MLMTIIVVAFLYAFMFLLMFGVRLSSTLYIIKGVMFVCLFVCLYLCSVWPAKRLGRSRPNLTHVLMSTQGVFLSRSMPRSFMYACGRTKHPERCAKATPGERCSNYLRRTAERHLANAYETPSGRRVITARIKRRGAAGAEQRAPKARVELRPEDG